MINNTPPGKLRQYLLGDLGPARRHLQRIRRRELSPSPGVIDEIAASVEWCVERIERDVPRAGDARSWLHMQVDHDLAVVRERLQSESSVKRGGLQEGAENDRVDRTTTS